MNPDNYLVEHCMFCDRPVMECNKHTGLRKKYKSMILDTSIIKGSC